MSGLLCWQLGRGAQAAASPGRAGRTLAGTLRVARAARGVLFWVACLCRPYLTHETHHYRIKWYSEGNRAGETAIWPQREEWVRRSRPWREGWRGRLSWRVRDSDRGTLAAPGALGMAAPSPRGPVPVTISPGMLPFPWGPGLRAPCPGPRQGTRGRRTLSARGQGHGRLSGWSQR